MTVTSSFACCRDLRAACRTPFNGVSCSDVEAFCKDDASSPNLLHWAQHKLHRGAECSAYSGMPYEFVPLEEIIAANQVPAASDEESAVTQLTAAVRAVMAQAMAPENRAATAVVGLGGLLVGVAVLGMISTLRSSNSSDDDQSGASGADDYMEPLLHTIPEMPVHEQEEEGRAGSRPGGLLRHVISSNYMLGSAAPSRTTSSASLISNPTQ